MKKLFLLLVLAVLAMGITTATRYRNYRGSFTGTGTGVTKVDEQELKLWFE